MIRGDRYEGVRGGKRGLQQWIRRSKRGDLREHRIRENNTRNVTTRIDDRHDSQQRREGTAKILEERDRLEVDPGLVERLLIHGLALDGGYLRDLREERGERIPFERDEGETCQRDEPRVRKAIRVEADRDG